MSSDQKIQELPEPEYVNYEDVIKQSHTIEECQGFSDYYLDLLEKLIFRNIIWSWS
jgi:hypothetical protein